jgi:hypothetical protein
VIFFAILPRRRRWPHTDRTYSQGVQGLKSSAKQESRPKGNQMHRRNLIQSITAFLLTLTGRTGIAAQISSLPMKSQLGEVTEMCLSDYDWLHMPPSMMQDAMAHFGIGECTVSGLIKSQIEREGALLS